MGRSATHIVKVFLDYEWPDWPVDEAWVRARFDLFHAFTLRSILGQTFKNFRLWLICGKKHRAVSTEIAAGRPYETIYDKGRAALAGIETDFVAITRMDSDDLMHENHMEEVHRNLVFDSTRGCLVCRKCLAWNRHSHFVGFHCRKSTPFFTHIFPKRVYKNCPLFERLHYVSHGRSGSGKQGAVELAPWHVCVVKHDGNITNWTRSNTPVVRSSAELEEFRQEGLLLTYDKNEMEEQLAPFGVLPDDL